MQTIRFLDRETGKIEEEKVYGEDAIRFLYGKTLIAKLLLPLFAKNSFTSHLFGALQKIWLTKRKIRPFIDAYHMDEKEFAKKPEEFTSFNDFFIRHLKHDARPIAHGNDVATLPADGRYLIYPNIKTADGFVIKGKKFSIPMLLQDALLDEKYQDGSLVIARLCPVDYHRFHFPCNGTAGEARLINGPLYSVNPLALMQNIEILAENKRMITEVETRNFGKILYIEVGATHVGSIHQTYHPNTLQVKGDEKGYFSFGGSTILLLFEKGTIQFDQDLLDASKNHLEVRGLMGQSMGRALKPL